MADQQFNTFIELLDKIGDSLVDLSEQQKLIEKNKVKLSKKEMELLQKLYQSNVELSIGVTESNRHYDRLSIINEARKVRTGRAVKPVKNMKRGKSSKSQTSETVNSMEDIPPEMFDEDSTIDLNIEEKKTKASFLKQERQSISSNAEMGEIFKVASLNLVRDVANLIPNLFNMMKKKSDITSVDDKIESEKITKAQLEADEDANKKLDQIIENTTPEMKKIKGGSILDAIKSKFGFLKNVGAFLMRPIRSAGVMGKTLLQAAGPFMIFGGLLSLVTKFIEGFNEGGLKQGLTDAFIGKFTGSVVETAFANAGTYALIGAGIGSMFAPGAGTIAGGIIGASVGILVNYIGRLIKSDASLGDKLTDFFFGGTGVVGVLFNGMKYAAMGALIGSVVPGAGTIIGGVVGFILGSVINIIKQMFPDLGKNISSMWTGFIDHMSEGINNDIKRFKSWFPDFSARFSYVFDKIKQFFDWIDKKTGIFSWFGKAIDKEKNAIKSDWNMIGKYWKDKFGKIIDAPNQASMLEDKETVSKNDKVVKSAKDKAKKIYEDMIKSFNQGTLGKDLLSGTIESVKGGFSYLKSGIPKLIGSVDKGFTSLIEFFKKIGDGSILSNGETAVTISKKNSSAKQLSAMSGKSGSTGGVGNANVINNVNNNVNNVTQTGTLRTNLRKK